MDAHLKRVKREKRNTFTPESMRGYTVDPSSVRVERRNLWIEPIIEEDHDISQSYKAGKEYSEKVLKEAMDNYAKKMAPR